MAIRMSRPLAYTGRFTGIALLAALVACAMFVPNPGYADIYDASSGAGVGGNGDLDLAAAQTITIDTDALTITGDDTATGDLDGGVAVFRFDNVNVTGGTVTVNGSAPLAIVANSDIVWDVPIDASGANAGGRVGGGAGAVGGAGGSTGVAGGNGGTGAGSGGALVPGGGGAPAGNNPGMAGGGRNGGAAGAAGAAGSPGAAGAVGNPGNLGVNGAGTVGTAGGFGAGGTAGGAGAGGLLNGIPGGGGGGGLGAANGPAQSGAPATQGGLIGNAGGVGGNAGPGSAGTLGGNSSFTVAANTLTLAGGSGGASGGGGGQGGSGGGGGQGGGGTSGAAGGGGGGVSATDCTDTTPPFATVFGTDAVGGNGGSGGAGGTGGDGGNGATAAAGNNGGAGGNGGGAVLLAAQGLLAFGGSVDVSAGTPGTGGSTVPAVTGAPGAAGAAGGASAGLTAGGSAQWNTLAAGYCTVVNNASGGFGGAGTDGGVGGTGGNGGNSGTSGAGGAGGSGTPGMVKLHGSVVLASGGKVTGNNALDLSTAQNGKFTFISNLTAAAVTANSPLLVTDGQFVTGSTTNDPILDGGTSFDSDVNHPKIGELDSVSGTEGILSGPYWNQTQVNAEVLGIRRLEIVRLDGDQPGDVYAGYDQIFLINNTAGTLVGVSLNVPGGSGLTLIPGNGPAGELAAGEVFTTTVLNGVTPTLGGPITFTNPADQTNRPILGGASFSVTATGQGTVTYQWQINTGSGFSNIANGTLPSGTIVAGATTDTLSLTSLREAENNATFRAVLTDNIQTQNTLSALLTVDAKIVVTLDPGGTSNGHPLSNGITTGTGNGGSLYFGTGMQLSVTASGGLPQTGPGPVYHYQWKLNGNPISAGDTASPFITPLTLAGSGNYTVDVSDESGQPTNTTSTAIAVTVVNSVALSGPAATQTVNVGNNAVFTVTASGGIPPYSYQWEFDQDPPGGGYVALSNGPNITGATTATLTRTVTGVSNVGRYRVVVTDSGCALTCPSGNKTSTDGTLVVTNNLNVIGPGNVNAYTGEAIAPSVNVVGGFSPFTVRWYKRPDTVTILETDNGAGPLFALDSAGSLGTADAGDIGAYFVTVQDASNPLFTSGDGNVDVRALPSTTDPANAFAYDGGTAVFSVTASGGYPPYSYDWRKGGVSLGAPDSATLNYAATLADDGETFDVIVSDSGGDSGPKTDTSATATLTVVAPLTVGPITPAPIARYTTEPGFVLTSIVTDGFPVKTYKWIINIPGTGDVDTALFAPVAVNNNDGTVNVNPVPTLEVGGLLRLEVTDAGGTVASTPIPFQLADPPSIDVLADANVAAGTNFSFDGGAIVSGGIRPLAFQWLDDSKAALTGETNPTLDFNPVDFDDAGNYAVQVTDSHPTPTTVTSNFAVLSVFEGLPVTGALGLGALAVAGALGGAFALRRRRQ